VSRIGRAAFACAITELAEAWPKADGGVREKQERTRWSKSDRPMGSGVFSMADLW